MKVTPPRRRGLAVLARFDGPRSPRTARVSNTTDAELGYVYWQTANWLVDEGLAYYPTGSTLLALTNKGRAAVAELGL